ncbi:MAG: hypothetical protein LBC42_01695, partial [Puniceicoccales bacterium]|nr:hypothetical protein [Puniceicoccales bacterium]
MVAHIGANSAMPFEVTKSISIKTFNKDADEKLAILLGIQTNPKDMTQAILRNMCGHSRFEAWWAYIWGDFPAVAVKGIVLRC